MLEYLKGLDTDMFFALNGSRSLFWDNVMMGISSTIAWIPALLILLAVIVRNNQFKNILLIVLFLALAIFVSDQFASTFCKNYFMRLRPTHDPLLMYMVDTVNGYRGGLYGFISSHAANTFAVSIFVSLLFRDGKLSFTMFVWAIITSYSRIYLGVHYPGDVLCGALSGLIFGTLCYTMYAYIESKMDRKKFISSQFNKQGYRNSDMQMMSAFVYLSFVGIIISAVI